MMAISSATGALFPFLPEAPDLLRKYGVTLTDLVSNRSFEAPRKRAVARVEFALSGEELAEIAVALSRDDILLEEVLSYVYGRILVSAINDPYLTKRYCVAEAKRFQERLKRLDSHERATSRAASGRNKIGEEVRAILEHLEVEFEEEGKEVVSLHFSDYLLMASGLDAKQWALALQRIQRGRVFIDRDRLFRLAQEKYRLKLLGEFPIAMSEPVFDAIQGDAAGLASKVAEYRARFETRGILDEASFPPCINKLMEMTGRSENVPHMGRFTLVAFLHTIGYDKEGLVTLFSRWPDFNIDKSMYQIQHITGESSGTEYTPPSCATMKTYGICYNPDQLCATIKHPLSYYRRKLRLVGRMPPPKDLEPGSENSGEP